MTPEEFALLGEQTRLVRGGLNRSGFDETSEAIYPTSGFVYGSAAEAEAAFTGDIDRYIYGRYGNPTVSMFEERLRLLEGAEHCFATASGMSAIYASLACQLSAGDRIVSSRALFGSCSVIVNEILPRHGVESVIVDGTDLGAWEQALSVPTDVVFLETPSNPGLDIVDIEAVAEMAHAAGACVVVDNVFASPVLQKPLELGADVVVYSATKHIDGQGRVLGGAVLCSTEFFSEKLQPFVRHTGPSLSPFNAWGPGAQQRCPDSKREIPDAPLPSTNGSGQASDVSWRHRRCHHAGRRQGPLLCGHGRSSTHRHLEQPGRLQESGDTPGHHHSPPTGFRDAGGPWNYRRHDSTVDRARRRRRSPR